MNLYYLLYYKIYSFLESTNAILKNTIIEWSAMAFVTILIGLNIFTIASIIEINRGIPLIEGQTEAKVLAVIVLILNYFIFNYKERYKGIVKKYSKKNTSFGSFLVLAYVIITIWSFFHTGSDLREIRLHNVQLP